MSTQAEFAEAAQLCERSRAIREKSLGPDHQDVARALNALAKVFIAQVTPLSGISRVLDRKVVQGKVYPK